MASMNMNDTDEKRYYWSPSVCWNKKNGEVRIEIFLYKDFVVDLFPEIYYLSQKGVTINELYKSFPNVDQRKLSRFIKDLVSKKILVSSIMSPHEIFFPQLKLFENKYDEDIFFDAEKLEEYKKEKLSRNLGKGSNIKINLEDDFSYPEYISNRVSYRSFKKDVISKEKFSRFISILRQRNIGNHIQYNYASAGGLYPIDVMIYVKKDRVEGIDRGLYYYYPKDNSLELVNNCEITSDFHYLTNKDIFNESAFTIFLIYNADVTMPKYGAMGYFYSCIDAGILVGSLTQSAELTDIGLCSIGDLNFKKIQKYFKLSENQVYLHAIEGGLK